MPQDTTPDQLAYIQKIAYASEIVSKTKQQHPEHDAHDLFRIVMLSQCSPEEKLATGLRRRIIGNVRIKN
jgi:hypothetical protein